MKYILDTASLLQSLHPQVTAKYRSVDLPDVLLPIVTCAELIRGRCEVLLKADTETRRIRASAQLKETLAFIRRFEIVLIDARLEQHLRTVRAGKPARSRSYADAMNAAIALTENSVLVTRNLKDFVGIPNLKVENWAV